jgi:multidrug efflux pump subunit AcrA (membrane-fusion protein)
MGKVRQVRLQSATVENVVNYTAVVTVNNESGRLLPGMTATVDFITGAADSALIVPNSALRFRPSTEQLEALRAKATSAKGRGSRCRLTAWWPGRAGVRRPGRRARFGGRRAATVAAHPPRARSGTSTPPAS